jgi:LysM repeat protein
MSVELIKKPINVFQTIDEQHKEELMETGIIVPDSKPDVMDVLVVDADIAVNTREKTGKIMEVGGEICYQVIYRADNQEQSLEAINVKAPWSVSFNFLAKEEDVHALVAGNVEHTNVDIVNGRKLSVKSVIKLSVKYILTKSIDAGEAVQGENVYQKADLQDIEMLEEMGGRTVSINETAQLPEGKPIIDEILYSHGTLRDVKVNENMTLDGILDIDFVYRVENDRTRIESMHTEVQVSKNIDIDNYRYTDIFVNASVKSLSLRPAEDLDGLLTRVMIEAEIAAEYALYTRESVHLVKDAYSLDYDFELEEKQVNVAVEERDITENIQLGGTIPLDCGGDTLEEIINVTVKPRLLSAGKDNTEIEVNGSLDVCILYTTGIEMRVVRGANHELPFTYRVPLPDPESVYESDVSLSLDQNSYEIISDNEMAVKSQITARIHLSKKKQIKVIIGVKGVKAADKKENPPVLVYYAEQGESLWNIGKRYKVPVQKILDDNCMEEEADPEAGQKILLIG